jgi:hypothetical protein
MDVLASRPVVIALAIAGAVLSTAASVLRARNRLGERGARNLNYAGYALMLASMVLFVAAGFRGAPA